MSRAEAPTLVQAEPLRELVSGILQHFGVPLDEARTVAEVLVRADLRGVDSHGVARLDAYYVGRLRRGLVPARSPAQVIRQTPTTALVDGGNGLGAVMHAGRGLVSGQYIGSRPAGGLRNCL